MHGHHSHHGHHSNVVVVNHHGHHSRPVVVDTHKTVVVAPRAGVSEGAVVAAAATTAVVATAATATMMAASASARSAQQQHGSQNTVVIVNQSSQPNLAMAPQPIMVAQPQPVMVVGPSDPNLAAVVIVKRPVVNGKRLQRRHFTIAQRKAMNKVQKQCARRIRTMRRARKLWRRHLEKECNAHGANLAVAVMWRHKSVKGDLGLCVQRPGTNIKYVHGHYKHEREFKAAVIQNVAPGGYRIAVDVSKTAILAGRREGKFMHSGAVVMVFDARTRPVSNILLANGRAVKFGGRSATNWIVGSFIVNGPIFGWHKRAHKVKDCVPHKWSTEPVKLDVKLADNCEEWYSCCSTTCSSSETSDSGDDPMYSAYINTIDRGGQGGYPTSVLLVQQHPQPQVQVQYQPPAYNPQASGSQLVYQPQPGYPPQQPGYPPQAGYPQQPGYPPQAGYPQQPGYPPQAGYPQQPGYLPQAGYPQQPGYPPQAAYPSQPGYPPQAAYPGQPPLQQTTSNEHIL